VESTGATRGLAGEPVRLHEGDGRVEVYYCDYRVRCLSSADLTHGTVL
jgi:hypothetical protein